MAIKMDGHTITSLQLKASDGSEVTKQLTEEGTIPTPTGSLSITANGTYDVTDKASAVINVPAPEINLQNKTATANGEVTADEGYDGLGTVTVAVSGDTPTYQEKTATANGVVLPDEGYDALSKVIVNVSGGITPSGKKLITDTSETDVAAFATAQISSDTLLAENIKKNVNILGVTGSFEGGGGSLPPDMTKQDMGSFTVVSDTLVKDKTISHSLGVLPKIVIVYSSNDDGEYPVETVLAAIKLVEDDYETLIDYNTNGSHTPRGQGMTVGSVTATDWKFVRNNTYYKAGLTYNWVAWA